MVDRREKSQAFLEPSSVRRSDRRALPPSTDWISEGPGFEDSSRILSFMRLLPTGPGAAPEILRWPPHVDLTVSADLRYERE